MRSILLFVSLLLLVDIISCGSSPYTYKVHKSNNKVVNNTLMVDGAPFMINGVCYSPVPIGEDARTGVKDDYYTLDYAYMWQRDLPLIKAMGANTIRLYGWNVGVDHTYFLDACEAVGLKVMMTYLLGDATYNPVSTEDQRKAIVDTFVNEVSLYKDHSAMLMWSFGNEINGEWYNYISQLSKAYNCGWSADCGTDKSSSGACFDAFKCVYPIFYKWINEALKGAKQVAPNQIFTSAFADVEYVAGNDPSIDKAVLYGSYLDAMDLWAIQLYRGSTFGDYFKSFKQEIPNKLILVTEYGADAYNDPCGWPENNDKLCLNLAGDGTGGDAASTGKNFVGCSDNSLPCSKPGVIGQLNWDVGLAQELLNNSFLTKTSYGSGPSAGGFVISWQDEYWKGAYVSGSCTNAASPQNASAAYSSPDAQTVFAVGGSAGCTKAAHPTCSSKSDSIYHDLCGYKLYGTSDNYVNEEWFGLNSVESCGLTDEKHLDSLKARPVVSGLAKVWGGQTNIDYSAVTCDALKECHQCCITKSMDELKTGICASVCPILNGVKFDTTTTSTSSSNSSGTSPSSSTTSAASGAAGTSAGGSAISSGTISSPTDVNNAHNGAASSTAGTTGESPVFAESGAESVRAGAFINMFSIVFFFVSFFFC